MLLVLAGWCIKDRAIAWAKVPENKRILGKPRSPASPSYKVHYTLYTAHRTLYKDLQQRQYYIQ